jgi:polar amino acid transport system substrate-binding protein
MLGFLRRRRARALRFADWGRVFAFIVSVFLTLVLSALGAPRGGMAQTSAAPSPESGSDRLALIQRRGAIIVGVKTDYAPFGGLNTQGEPEGLEHDLAADLAKRLGVRLTKVSVTSANRLQRLEDGTVDVVIATLGDTAERRRIATLVEPNYYASGVTLFVRPDSTIRDWPDLRGQTVCATQGAYFNREMARRYLLELQVYNLPRDARMAVRDGRCAGYLFDHTAIAADLRNPEWAGYRAPLVPVLSAPWAIAIARKEKGSALERLLGDTVADWHRSGFLQDRERAWGLTPSRFLEDARRIWSRTDVQGSPMCARQPDGQWPAACRNAAFVSSVDVSGLQQWGLRLRETSGLDLSMIYDPDDRSAFFSGLGLTLALTLCCIIGSMALGLLGAMLGESRIGALRGFAALSNIIGRMTPPLLQIYLVLFGLGSVLAAADIRLSPFWVAVACLSFYTGAGVMSALREGAQLHRQTDPAYRIHPRRLAPIVPLCSGAVVAALVNVAKATMMASAVAVPELLSATTTIMAERGNVGVMMNTVLLVFLLLIMAVVRLLGWLERRLLGRATS